MPIFSTKVSRMTSSRLPFKKKAEKYTDNDTPEPFYPQRNNDITSRNFMDTLNVISKEAMTTQFDDVFDSFFFNDKRCQNRAIFMVSRLKQALDEQPIVLNPSYSTPISAKPPHLSLDPKQQTVDVFWRTITHRLYTLNYILFVLPHDSTTRTEFLRKLEADLALIGDGRQLERKGGMEVHFAVRYALNRRRPKRRKTLLEDAFELEKKNGGSVAGAILPSRRNEIDEEIRINKLVEQARLVVEQCLESELKLGHAEKDAMYIFHGMRAGLLGAFEPRIELEEDRSLRHRLRHLVIQNKEAKKPDYENPFEDEECVVVEEELYTSEIDSGFYEGCPPLVSSQ
ncbi:hypothetical protein BDB01DRAFT_712847 [Pilobolus umbonatus]|nr:hypothetical protein BDB01DRAFT_712847 [Pilobolus umbonatus]